MAVRLLAFSFTVAFMLAGCQTLPAGGGGAGTDDCLVTTTDGDHSGACVRVDGDWVVLRPSKTITGGGSVTPGELWIPRTSIKTIQFFNR